MNKSMPLFVLAFLIVGISFASAGSNLLVAGKVYTDMSFSGTLNNASIVVSCSHAGLSNSISTTTDISDGSYGVVFALSKCNDTDVVTIISSGNPMYVSFLVDEEEYPVTVTTTSSSGGGGGGSNACYVDAVCTDWSGCNDGVQVCMAQVKDGSDICVLQNPVLGTTRTCSVPAEEENTEEAPTGLLGITGNAINGLTGAATGVLGETGLAALGVFIALVLAGLGVVTFKKAEWKSSKK